MVTLRIPHDNDIARLIREAEEAGEPLLVDTGDTLYELDIHVVAPEVAESDSIDDQPDAILGIIGLGSSSEPTDVSVYKHEYLAEAFDSTPK